MSDEAILQRADAIKEAAHKGQTRWNGEPYTTHPDAIERYIIYGKLTDVPFFNVDQLCDTNPIGYLVLRVVIKLHDVFEDNPNYKLDFDSVAKLFEGLALPDMFIKYLHKALVAITKLDTETYVEYIARVKSDWFATVAKLGDLKHNLSDLNAGAKRDKYELTYYILSRAWLS